MLTASIITRKQLIEKYESTLCFKGYSVPRNKSVGIKPTRLFFQNLECSQFHNVVRYLFCYSQIISPKRSTIDLEEFAVKSIPLA